MPLGPFRRLIPQSKGVPGDKMRVGHINKIYDALETILTPAEVATTVHEAIADDPTIIAVAEAAATDAAPAAVTAEIAGRDMLDARDNLTEDYAVNIVDEDGRRTWLEAGMDGGLTDYSVDKISEHIAGAVDMDSDVTGLAFALTVTSGDGIEYRTELETGLDGKLTDRVIASIANRIGVTAPTAAIACWGDSLTAASYPAELSTTTGRAVRTYGIGGDTSAGIAARSGAQPFRVTPSGGSFPASGPVAVTLAVPSGADFSARLATPTWPGAIRGVPGVLETLSEPPGATFRWVRRAAGDALPVTDPPLFIPDAYADLRSCTNVIWAGTNNADQTDRVLADVDAMVRAMGHTRYLVLTTLNSSAQPVGSAWTTALLATNTALVDRYGGRCLDIRQYLINHGLADAGITPTTQDTTDIANGIVPTSLRVDGLHLTATGFALVADKVAERLNELELI